MQNTQQKLRPAHVKQAVSGLPYPASREEIIEYARDKGAPTGVLDVLALLPPKLYRNEAGVLAALDLDRMVQPASGEPARAQKPLEIPRELPQFEDKLALFLVLGRQEMITFAANGGLIAQIAASRLPTPHYSDNEGRFEVRGGDGDKGPARSGVPRELDDENIMNDAMNQFAADLRMLRPDAVDEIYLFVPEHIRPRADEVLPAALAGKVVLAVSGNFFHAHPLDLLRKVQKAIPEPVLPEKPEARKILEKSEQARGVIKGRPRNRNA